MENQSHTLINLSNLFRNDASKFNSAEIQLKNSLQEWIGIADSPKLKDVLQKYLVLIQKHLDNLEAFFTDEEMTDINTKNRVMEACIIECDDKIESCLDKEVRDAGLLACVQLINHVKISTYGTAAAFAKVMQMDKYASIFYEAEINEKQIDNRLSQLAEFEINIRAKSILLSDSNH